MVYSVPVFSYKGLAQTSNFTCAEQKQQLLLICIRFGPCEVRRLAYKSSAVILLTTVVCDLKGVYIIPVQHSRRYEVESLDCVYINHFYGGVLYFFERNGNECKRNTRIAFP